MFIYTYNYVHMNLRCIYIYIYICLCVYCFSGASAVVLSLVIPEFGLATRLWLSLRKTIDDPSGLWFSAAGNQRFWVPQLDC